MKKIFFSCIIAVLSGFLLAGCSSESCREHDPHSIETTSQPFTERNVEKSDSTYIFDEAGLLSADDYSACNDYAGWLYKNKLINAAVITVDKLDGKSPYDYAAEKYNEKYEGKGSGLLVLINNDTNEDVVYRTGSCLSEISDKADKNAVYWATKEIFGGSYRKGIMRLLQLGELCPSHIINNAQVFDAESIRGFEKKLSDCKEDITLIATKNMSDASNESILKAYYERKYTDKGIMVLLDINSKSVTAYSAKKLPSGFEAALKKANELTAKGENTAAVESLTEALKK